MLSRTRDKLNEAKYFLAKLSEVGPTSSLTRNSVARDEFRYLLSSFLTSARSVTFVLQSELRPRFGQEFDPWYNKTRWTEEDGFFKKLRNFAQKEGGGFIRFRFAGPLRGESTLVIDIDESQVPSRRLVTVGVEFPAECKFELLSGCDETSFADEVISFLGDYPFFRNFTSELRSAASKMTLVGVQVDHISKSPDDAQSVKELLELSTTYLEHIEQVVSGAIGRFEQNN